ncbi:hypothetical protein CDV31_010371 [Fusarium ambrosium]|uniref:Uncharacterized protein n=1 Tax=Fusarium ambrosium TaxID=131363 RepID=A0A428TP43_9HYPO|nr:hypothetical protein CDV31_010371 [Fusarium ambrosium]
MPGNNFNKFLRRKKDEGTTLPMHTRSQIPEPVVNTSPYLLMCIDRGRHFTGLYQHVLQNVEDDTQLFQFLRDNVSRHRGISSWLTFRSVNAISLTRVCPLKAPPSILPVGYPGFNYDKEHI